MELYYHAENSTKLRELFLDGSLVEEDVHEIGLLPTGALAPCLDSSLKKLQHAAYIHCQLLRPRVMPAQAGIQGPSATSHVHLTDGVQSRYAGDG